MAPSLAYTYDGYRSWLSSQRCSELHRMHVCAMVYARFPVQDGTFTAISNANRALALHDPSCMVAR